MNPFSGENIQKWALGVGCSLIMSATGLYAHYMTTTVDGVRQELHVQADKMAKVELRAKDEDFKLEILDAKIDLVIHSLPGHIQYIGPKFPKRERDTQVENDDN